MIKARASGSKVFSLFYEKGQAGAIPHSADFFCVQVIFSETIRARAMIFESCIHIEG